MLRVLVVLGLGAVIDIREYANVFNDVHLEIAKDNNELCSRIGEFDPNVIVSLGSIGLASSLWSMPLWRRRVWLNLPRTLVAPQAVKQTSLSLVAANLDGDYFRDSPLIAVVPLSGESAESLANTAIQIVTRNAYENLEFLIPEDLFLQTQYLVRWHLVASMVRPMPMPKVDSYPQILQSCLATTKADFIWPVDGTENQVESEFLEFAIHELLRNSVKTSGLVGRNLTSTSIPEYIKGEADMDVTAVLIRTEHLLEATRSQNLLPLRSLAGILLHLLDRQQIQCIELELPQSIRADILRREPDPWKKNLLDAAIHRALMVSLTEGTSTTNQN